VQALETLRCSARDVRQSIRKRLERRFVVSRFENPAQFDTAYPNVAPHGSTVKTLVLMTALLAYAVGFVILSPIVASSVTKSISDGNDPALLEFVGP
jgi:hypothetical protein